MVTASMMCIERSQDTRVSWNLELLSSTDGDRKLYEWTDPAGGWDGKYKGKDVAQGTYFVNVTAKGADGKVFNIKRDVNLLRGYSQTTPNN